MEIKNKLQPDPVVDYHVVDVYMRWALQAVEEVTGKQGMAVVLRNAGLERFIDRYPSEEMKITDKVTYGDYARLCTGLLDFYGRAGKSMVIRIGRTSARYAIEQQSGLFNVGTIAAGRILPLAVQQRLVLENMANGFRKLHKMFSEELHLQIEDRQDRWAYIAHECPVCAGKTADQNICWLFTGNIAEALRWMTGKDFSIEEVECRAQGAAACVWEVSKTAKE